MAGSDLHAKLASVKDGADYLYEFGRFINNFAAVEGQYKYLFHQICGLSEDVARAIIGGMRMGDAMSLLSRVAKASKLTPEQKQELQTLIDQTNEIARLRDPLVHRGILKAAWVRGRTKGSSLMATDYFAAKSSENVDVLIVRTEDLAAAADDLGFIWKRLFFFLKRARLDELSQEQNDGPFAPWRYRHTARGNRPSRPRKGDR